MKEIIDIHGQHENQTLMDESTHIKFLDNFAEKEIKNIKEKYIQKYKVYNELKQEINENFGDDKEKQRELDLLMYQYNEIQEVNLKIGEEEELGNIRQKILNSEKITNSLQETSTQISENVIDSISIAVRALEKIQGIDKKYENSLNSLKSIYYDIQELSRDIDEYKEDTYFDEEERNKIETRLDLIYILKRKYGNSIEEILKYSENVKERIEKIKNSEEYVNKLKENLHDITKEMEELCDAMNKIRCKYGKILEESINKELAYLEMKNAKFFVKINKNNKETNSNVTKILNKESGTKFDKETNNYENISDQKKFGPNGLDKIEFMICTNIGEDEKPLAKMISGGEMSRIMLAIKNVLADIDKVSTMVFDEVDTGISGNVANSVGEKLKEISKKHQVLCVTHLANIAAKGNYNYFICKQVEENRTKTIVKKLNEEETIKEIARIASGNVNDIAIEHAKELRKSA